VGWPTHHPVANAERVHDIEGEQSDVRRLEHITAGVEHEVRDFSRLRHRCRLLAEPLQHVAIELQTREYSHVPAEITEFPNTLTAPVGELILGLRHRDTRHREQEARVNSVVASLYALTTEHARRSPFARRVGTKAGAHDVEHTTDNVFRTHVADASRPNARTDFDALSTSRASVKHVVDAAAESHLEGDFVHWLQIQHFSLSGVYYTHEPLCG
jgi:hypothetical protein